MFCSFMHKELYINGFDDIKWKGDSLSCNGYRVQVYATLYCNKSKFMGCSIKELVGFLGKSNDTVHYDWTNEVGIDYFIEKGAQCNGAIPKKDLDIKELEFVFKENKMVRVQISAGGWPSCE